MTYITYKNKKFIGATLDIIDKANDIITSYQDDGYTLTLRQLYYQFVSKGYIDNNIKSYKRLVYIINDARLAGMVSWKSIEDRTRNLAGLNHWDSPAEIVQSAVDSYRIDKWEDQPYRIEVWIEKEALSAVFERICNELDIDYFCCRGYVSQSEMWNAGQRLINYSNGGQTPIILHFGDHDPSGIDMSRDITDRIIMFAKSEGVHDFELHRIALNMDQVKKYKPPPNPAKLTDSRCKQYMRDYGNNSWELDALDPKTLSALVKKHVLKYRDNNKWNKSMRQENKEIKVLRNTVEGLL